MLKRLRPHQQAARAAEQDLDALGAPELEDSDVEVVDDDDAVTSDDPDNEFLDQAPDFDLPAAQRVNLFNRQASDEVRGTLCGAVCFVHANTQFVCLHAHMLCGCRVHADAYRDPTCGAAPVLGKHAVG